MLTRRCIALFLGIANRFEENDVNPAFLRAVCETLAARVVGRVLPSLAIPVERGRIQIDRVVRRDAGTKYGLRLAFDQLQCWAVEEEAPTPKAQLGTRRTNLIGAVEHARLKWCPETRAIF